MGEGLDLLLLPLWYVVFLLSLTCHEAAHAFVAHRGGDDTAYRAGQVSLNPIPHLRREPFGTILVPLVTFFQLGYMMGWASAPYDPEWERRHPFRAAAMSAAGPLANLALALVAFAGLRIGLVAGQFTAAPPHEFGIARLVAAAAGAPEGLDGVGRMLSVLLVLNLVLFLFNLIPLPPLDGASVLSGLSAPARRLRERAEAVPFASLVGLVLAWYLFDFVFGPVFHWVLVRLFA